MQMDLVLAKVKFVIKGEESAELTLLQFIGANWGPNPEKGVME